MFRVLGFRVALKAHAWDNEKWKWKLLFRNSGLGFRDNGNGNYCLGGSRQTNPN